MIELEQVIDLFHQEDEVTYGDFIYDTLLSLSGGDIIEFSEDVQVPANWVVTVVDVNTDRDYDSYGNGYNNDAYVVFSVTNGDEVKLFKLPGSYMSFEGWNWKIDKIRPVTQNAKTVLFWEETRD